MLSGMKKSRSTKLFIAVFVLPTFLVYCIFGIYPVINSFITSFYKWSGYSDVITFVGTKNYERLFSDGVFFKSIWHDLILLFWKEIFIIAIALFLAFCLTKIRLGRRATGFYRFVFFFPNVLSIVIIGILWSFIYHPNIGLLNGLLKSVGLEALTTAWLGDQGTALAALIPIACWAGIGLFMIVFIAGINNISEELYESAALDGAGTFRQFWSITLPGLWEQLKFSIVTILFTTLSANVNLILVTTNGGPDNATQVMGSYVYQQAFTNFKVGYANAAAMVMLVICVLLCTVTNKLLGRSPAD